MRNSEYSKWIGKTQEKKDKLAPTRARFMENTLNRDATLTDGDELPPLWHWLYFLDSEKISRLGRDGHPQKSMINILMALLLQQTGKFARKLSLQALFCSDIQH